MKTRKAVTLQLVFLLLAGGGGAQIATPWLPGLAAQQSDLGIFGSPEEEWDAGEYAEIGTTDDGFRYYETDTGHVFYVGFDQGMTSFVEYVYPGELAFGDMEEYIQGLLPSDADLVDEYTDILVADDSERFTVQIYYSDAVYSETSSPSGNILVTYGGPDIETVTRVSLSLGR